MKKRVTIWLDEGKPLKVKATKTEEFYIEDLSKLLDALKDRGMEGATSVIKQTKND